MQRGAVARSDAPRNARKRPPQQHERRAAERHALAAPPRQARKRGGRERAAQRKARTATDKQPIEINVYFSLLERRSRDN